MGSFSRMLGFLLATIVLIALALWVQSIAPGTLIAVTLYKAHLMALGGWGGYWLDRGLFPYDRPHQYWEQDESDSAESGEVVEHVEVVASSLFGQATLRRAIIVAACLICVGLGA
jgi:Putative 2/3 transmembrane domain holin